MKPGVAALNLGVMRAASAVADHWVQTTHQAAVKGAYDDAPIRFGKDGPGSPGFDLVHGSLSGRVACAAHVASYVASQVGAVTVASRVCGVRLDPKWVAAGAAVSGVTHYWADRRRPLRKLADKVGKGPFYGVTQGGINGAYLLDQSFHHGVEAIASVIMSIGARSTE